MTPGSRSRGADATLFEAPPDRAVDTRPATALQILPVAVQHVLTRRDRNGRRLRPDVAEEIAVWLPKAGLSGADALTWMAAYVSWRLGVGNFPVAPSGLRDEAYDLAKHRADALARYVDPRVAA